MATARGLQIPEIKPLGLQLSGHQLSSSANELEQPSDQVGKTDSAVSTRGAQIVTQSLGFSHNSKLLLKSAAAAATDCRTASFLEVSSENLQQDKC